MLPLTDTDTIVAISTGWDAAPLGIVRLSGPASFGLVEGVLTAPLLRPSRPGFGAVNVRFSGQRCLPAELYWFPAPRSYTGQDMVELHTLGALPLLRMLAGRLVEAGARRALPGEFTARALRSGKLTSTQVAGVLALMQAQQEATLRQAARLVRDSDSAAQQQVRSSLADLIALVEAGIDFVDEEDVRFITSAELRGRLAALLTTVRNQGAAAADTRAGHIERPCVALAGRPNAGKSTLFNALVGHARAIVSPVVGTTRDVLSAPVQLGEQWITLQDCAGLGATSNDLELATHHAAERAAAQADVVLWVHSGEDPWDAAAAGLFAKLPGKRRVLVLSKSDRPVTAPHGLPPVEHIARVSALTGDGLDALRRMLSGMLADVPAAMANPYAARWHIAGEALQRALDLVPEGGAGGWPPELVALELRLAWENMSSDKSESEIDEEILNRVYSQFCVGK